MTPAFIRIQPPLAGVIVFFGLVVVGALDYVTGADVQLNALYFLPLALAGWQLGRVGAIVSAMLATGVWLFARGPQPLMVVLINSVAQGLSFLMVSMLVAALARALRVESALRRIDSLTGLPNRAAFMERAEAGLLMCRRNHQSVSMAFVDLNDFKRVNDSFGHARGDELLKVCAGVLLASVRETDVPARLGGDEFVVFLPDTDVDASSISLERLRMAFAGSNALRAAGVSASVGMVVDENASLSVSGLLAQADARMYAAKRADRSEPFASMAVPL